MPGRALQPIAATLSGCRSSIPLPRQAVTVTTCWRICCERNKFNLSQVFAGQTVGAKQVDGQIWLASFLNYDLGFFDRENDRVEPATNPFAPEKV